MININHILQGWANFIEKPEVIEEIAKDRAEICSKCSHAKKSMLLVFVKDSLSEIEGYKCNKCQCPLSAKLRSNDNCPIGKW